MKSFYDAIKIENTDYSRSSATASVIPDLIRNLNVACCFFKVLDQVRNDEKVRIRQS